MLALIKMSSKKSPNVRLKKNWSNFVGQNSTQQAKCYILAKKTTNSFKMFEAFWIFKLIMFLKIIQTGILAIVNIVLANEHTL